MVETDAVDVVADHFRRERLTIDLDIGKFPALQIVRELKRIGDTHLEVAEMALSNAIALTQYLQRTQKKQPEMLVEHGIRLLSRHTRGNNEKEKANLKTLVTDNVFGIERMPQLSLGSLQRRNNLSHGNLLFRVAFTK
jgi:hypothetical protein